MAKREAVAAAHDLRRRSGQITPPDKVPNPQGWPKLKETNYKVRFLSPTVPGVPSARRYGHPAAIDD